MSCALGGGAHDMNLGTFFLAGKLWCKATIRYAARAAEHPAGAGHSVDS